MNRDVEYIDFVTGGTGLVGSHVLLELARKGTKIRALRREGSNIENLRKVFRHYSAQADEWFDGIEWVYGDLLDAEQVGGLLEGVRNVYHCAALVSFDPKDENAIWQANVEGTKHMVENCISRGVAKLCFVSSVSALGKPVEDASGMVDEQTPYIYSAGLSQYAQSKYESEQEVWKGVDRGLRAVVVNPSIIIGPGDWDRSSANIIKRVWRGFPFYTTGVNSFVDVRDVSRAMIELTESSIQSERFILTAENWSFQKLLFTIADHLGKRRPMIKARKGMGEIAWYVSALLSRITGQAPSVSRATVASAYSENYFSNAKLKKSLNFEFISVEQSIADTCRIFLQEISTGDS